MLASTFLLYSVGLGAGAVPTAGALNWVLKVGADDDMLVQSSSSGARLLRAAAVAGCSERQQMMPGC